MAWVFYKTYKQIERYSLICLTLLIGIVGIDIIARGLLEWYHKLILNIIDPGHYRLGSVEIEQIWQGMR